MDYASAYRGEDDQTVRLRVQVVDIEPRTLDLRLPTFLPTRDVTQRIARDAGLLAHWDDGQRRLYWLRARGRLLGEEEKLGEVGVVDGELVYVLPQPPAGSGVIEQNPDYPETHDYAGSGIIALIGTLTLIFGWCLAWGAAMTVSHHLGLAIAPGLALGLLCCNFARHAWGGSASRLRVVLTALALLFMVLPLPAFTAWSLGQPAIQQALSLAPPPAAPSTEPIPLFMAFLPGIIAGALGVFTGWLAWWGAVEPLPVRVSAPVQQIQHATATTTNCGICGGGVSADVQMPCPYQCGQAFHVGCHRARVSVYRGDNRFCAICNQRVA